MDLSKQETNKEDHLNDSWVELQFQQQQQQFLESQSDIPLPPQSIHNGVMEKLLLEAQKESNNTSRASSRGSPHNSPKGPHSPKSEVGPSLISLAESQNEGLTSIVQRELGTEWVWDWSSRPECIPPSDHGKQFKRPTSRHKLSVRNSEFMGLNFKSLSVLLLTHACTLFVGAAAMFLWMKKPCSRCGATLALLN